MHTVTQQPAFRATRRGFSFLEAVLAAALLAIIASSIFTVLGYAMASDRTDTARLGAAEVANRVLISYIDDSTSIRKLPDTIDYGGNTFRWDLDDDYVRIEEPNRQNRVTSGKSGAVPTALVRLKEVRVTVWQDDGTIESRQPGATPGVRLNRLINPFGYRGADSTERILESPERITELLKHISEYEEPDPEDGPQGSNP